MLHRALAGYLLAGATLAAVSLAAGGSPPFWLWWVLLTVLNSLHVVIVPATNTLAMTPMGQIAGTASAVIGAFSMGVGSMLASITSRFGEGSVTPLSLGYLGYGALAATCVLLASRAASGHRAG